MGQVPAVCQKNFVLTPTHDLVVVVISSILKNTFAETVEYVLDVFFSTLVQYYFLRSVYMTSHTTTKDGELFLAAGGKMWV